MQRPRSALLVIIAVLFVSPFLERTADAEVSLEKLVHHCLLLENFWELNPEMDNDIHFPNNGEAVCYGYLLAFRGLEGAVEGTDCRRSNDKAFAPGLNCHRTLHVCVPEHTSDRQILAVFLAYAGNHVAHWREGASSYYLSAMQEAFPCRDERN
jgi:hypothetical protein